MRDKRQLVLPGIGLAATHREPRRQSNNNNQQRDEKNMAHNNNGNTRTDWNDVVKAFARLGAESNQFDKARGILAFMRKKLSGVLAQYIKTEEDREAFKAHLLKSLNLEVSEVLRNKLDGAKDDADNTYL